jgi:hypothetical protein
MRENEKILLVADALLLLCWLMVIGAVPGV